MNDQIIRDRNIATVHRFYQSERDRDLATWLSLWRSDGRQTFPTLGPGATVDGVAALEAVTKEKFQTRPPYGINTEVAAFADPYRVFASLSLDFPDVPRITVWCVFRFDENGLVAEVEEIFDRGIPEAA